MRFLHYIIFILCFTTSISLIGQNKADSLLLLIKKDKADTNKINHLNALGYAIMYQNPDTSIILSNQALAIAKKLKWQKGLASSYNNLGVYNWVKGQFPKSFEFHFKSLKIREQINDKVGIAMSFGNIGIVYWSNSETQKALNYLLKALKIYESIGDMNGVAKNLGNIGVLYDQFNKVDQAIVYYKKALELNHELGAKDREATQLGNLGVAYHKMANDTTIKNDQKKELQNKAIAYYLLALNIEKSLSNNGQAARQLGNLGSLYIQMNQFKKAEEALLEAISIYEQLNVLNEKMQFEFSISELYYKMGNLAKSLEYYKRFTSDKDTIFNQEKNNEITRNELNYEFEKKEAALKAQQDKKNAVDKADKKRQFLFLLLVAFIAVAVAIIAIIVFRSLRKTKKQKAIIELQKHEVEEKQKEILDSIHYAKRIQTALLPQNKYIEKKLNQLNK